MESVILSASEESAAAILAAAMDFLRQTQPNRAAKECRADPSTPLADSLRSEAVKKLTLSDDDWPAGA